MAAPIICFGQQPCGFFPKRFLYAKIVTARQLQQEIGGEIVFFLHDSDHDPRETITILRERHSGREHRVNFRFLNSIQKEFSPLYAKRILPGWHSKLLLHKGADRFIELPSQDFDATQISPTRDTRLRWMQSVIQCTHYVAGAGEQEYLNEADTPGITFVLRMDISESDKAYTEN